MIDRVSILALLGIPDEKVKMIDCAFVDVGVQKIFIELVDDKPYCPNCGSVSTTIHGYYNVNINNQIIKNMKLSVEIRMRRYKCKDCGKTFKQSLLFYDNKCRISFAVKSSILDDLKKTLTYSQIARDYDLSVNTIINIFDSIPRIGKLALPETMCVDEFHFSKDKENHSRYPFVISNPFTGDIVDIVEKRTKFYLNDYFARISFSDRKRVKYFISDMNETYRSIRKVFFPDAIHIIDHFHIIKLFNEAIMSIRTKIMKEKQFENSKEYKFLKKHWKIFQANRKDLYKYKVKDTRHGIVMDWADRLDICLKKYPNLHYAYWAREEFKEYVADLHYYYETKEKIDFFINKYTNCLVPEINKIGRTFESWKNEIIAAYAKTTYGKYLSNSIAEANNNNIQTLIDLAYGFVNFERFRNRILYINRNRK